MEQTPLPPLVRFTPVHEDAMVCEADGAYVRIADMESELLKTREVVRALVDHIAKHGHDRECFYSLPGCGCGIAESLDLAKSQLQIEPTK